MYVEIHTKINFVIFYNNRPVWVYMTEITGLIRFDIKK